MEIEVRVRTYEEAAVLQWPLRDMADVANWLAVTRVPVSDELGRALALVRGMDNESLTDAARLVVDVRGSSR